jgi:hypothetical protein
MGAKFRILTNVGCLGYMSRIKRRPYGTRANLIPLIPTLKRGANKHCAYGAFA